MEEGTIMKTYIVALATLILVLLPDWAKAQGNLVFNGGFDISAVGWIITNASFGGYESTKGNPAGDVALDVIPPSPITDPVASQTIHSLIPGAIYVLSGDYRRITDRGGGSPTDISFGVAIDSIFLFGTVAPTDNNWYSFNFLYTAAAPTAILSLSSQMNGTGISYAIDNIAMQGVPEPSSLWLMCVGGIASAISFMRHRKRLL